MYKCIPILSVPRDNQTNAISCSTALCTAVQHHAIYVLFCSIVPLSQFDKANLAPQTDIPHMQRNSPQGGCVQVQAVYPNSTDNLLLMGAAYYHLGEYQQSVQCNDFCILLDPQIAEAHANLANSLQQLGHLPMAALYYQARTLSCFSSPCPRAGSGCCTAPLARPALWSAETHFPWARRGTWLLFLLFIVAAMCAISNVFPCILFIIALSS